MAARRGYEEAEDFQELGWPPANEGEEIMGRVILLALGVVFFLQGTAVLYAFSPWGPARDVTAMEVLSNFSLFGFPASFLCFSAAHVWSGKAGRSSSRPFWELGACVVLWFLSMWLTMLTPWNLIARLGAAILAAACGVLALARGKGV